MKLRRIFREETRKITLSFTDVGKSCPCREFLHGNYVFNAIHDNKITAKISEFAVFRKFHAS